MSLSGHNEDRADSTMMEDRNRTVAELVAILETERTMHNAWRKRAEEAEAELSALKNLK